MKSTAPILILILLFMSLVCFLTGCHNQEEAITDYSDSLIVPKPEIIHFNGQDSLDINFRVLKGNPITSILPIEIYNSRDSIESDNKIVLNSIAINGSNRFNDIDTVIPLGTYAFFHYFRINNAFALIQRGDNWIINYEVFTNDGGTIINKMSTIISYDNFFAGKYVDSIYYFNSKTGSYPNQPASKKILDKDLISIDDNNCITDFVTGNIIGEKSIIYVGPGDSVSISAINEKYQLKMGDPKDASKVSGFDDKTGIIYLYYNYSDTEGINIIWETLIPEDKN